MSFYQDAQTVYDVMSELFRRVMATPSAQHELRRANMVLRLVLSGPDCALTLDARSQRPRFLCGVDKIPADLVMRMPSEVLHRVWLSEMRLRDAYFSGQIRVEGSVFRALGLAALFRQVEAWYPKVLQDKDLLPKR